MKASEPEWYSQRQVDSISYKKNIRHLTRYMPQLVACQLQKFQVSYEYTYHEISVVPYLEMIGTYPIAGIHETVRY